LFLFYINDIDVGVVNILLKSADDTKIAVMVSNRELIDQWKIDLIRLFEWSND